MPGNQTMRITFTVEGDGKGFKVLAQQADGLKTAISSTVAEVGKLNTSAINFAAFSTIVDQTQSAIRELQSALLDLNKAYQEQAVVETQLETVMKQRMNATDAEVESIKRLASEQQKLGVIGDEVQLAGAQQVATFLKEKQSLETLIPAMNNLLAQQNGLNATSSDAISIANLMGKAMQGQTSALRRVGITFTDTQEHVMKFGSESERAAMLSQIITDNVGDMNAQLAKTDVGKQKQLENKLGDIKEKLGHLTSHAMPFITMGAQAATAALGVSKLWGGFLSLNRAIWTSKAGIAAWNMIARLITPVSGAASTGLTAMGVSATAAGTAMNFLKVAIRGVMSATGIGAVIAVVTIALEALVTALDSAVNSMDELSEAEQRNAAQADKLRAAREEMNNTITSAMSKYDLYTVKCKNFNGTKAEEERLCKELNEAYGDTLGYYYKVNQWYETLTKNSKAYCDQLTNEAYARLLANQIAENKLELRKYEKWEAYWKKQREKDQVANVDNNLQTALTGYDPKIIKNPFDDNASSLTNTFENISANWNANMEYNAHQQAERLRAQIVDYQNELEKTLQASADIKFEKPAPQKAPRGTSTGSNTPQEKELTYYEDPKNISEIDESIAYKEKELKTATLEQAEIINKQIESLRKLRKAYTEIGTTPSEIWTEAPKTVKEYNANLSILRNRLLSCTAETAPEVLDLIKKMEDGKEAILGTGKAAADVIPKYNEKAETLRDINANISILTDLLETAGSEEAEALAKGIKMWERKANAIRNTGEAAKGTFSTFKEGWSVIGGLNTSISGMVKNLSSSASAWEKLVGAIDSSMKIVEAIIALVDLVKDLTGVTKEHQAAKEAETASEVANLAIKVAGAGVEEGIQAANIATDQTETQANVQLAASKILASFAGMPFGTGFLVAMPLIASIPSILKSIKMFAKGGIAYGPTLGLFGEYVGASNNPEVVAPLDRLRTLIQPAGFAGEVRFHIEGRTLVGVLKKETNLINRS